MSSSEEEEEMLIHVEFDGIVDKDVLDRPPVLFKMIGAEGRKPVMQIGNQTFAGEYRDVVGTALFFEENPNPPVGDPVFTKTSECDLRYLCKTRKALHMSRVFLKRINSGENSDAVLKQKTTVRGNSSDEVTMEVEELPVSGKQHSSKSPEIDVLAPCSSSSCPDVSNLGTLMKATASNTVSEEMSGLIEEQIQDNIAKLVTDSDGT